MRRAAALGGALLVVMVLGAAACVPPAPPAPAAYLDSVYGATVTPKAAPVTWGGAPPIDAHYGGTLYAGTSLQTQDPRPPLLANGDEPLRLWVAAPQNRWTDRPAILWVHGGGFATGIDTMYGLANGAGKAYAQRGYVGFSVEYRIDTTMVGQQSLCQWVQDHEDPSNPVWVQRAEQCRRNVLTAQHDVQGALRWIRRHAAQYGIDPNKVAVGGFSAGAVTAANLAYRGDDVGTQHYFAGDDLSVAASRVQAGFGASGCEYLPESIGAGDAPTSWIHSQLDPAVPYPCIAQNVTVARSRGLVAELTSYCGQSLHAQKLYAAHREATDLQWTTFLARHLSLYSDMRPPSSDPVCP